MDLITMMVCFLHSPPSPLCCQVSSGANSIVPSIIYRYDSICLTSTLLLLDFNTVERTDGDGDSDVLRT